MPPTSHPRYSLVPHLESYDNLPSIVAPYLAFTAVPRFHSGAVNTDENGFRISVADGRSVDSSSWWEAADRGLVLGGSFAFGWGSESDTGTISSYLSANTAVRFLNLGIRGGNSTQELIASLPFLHASGCVVLCSGLNNVTVAIQSLGLNDLYGPLFFEENYEAMANHAIWDLAEVSATYTDVRLTLSHLRSLVSPKSKIAPRINIEPTGPDPSTAGTRALALQTRDLEVLLKARPRDCRVIFAVQPFAPFCQKELTSEEHALFEISNRSADWRNLKTELSKLWPTHVAGLETFCRDHNVEFVDLNRAVFEGWCFIDSVHMTSAGYSQAADAISDAILKGQA